MTWIVYALAFLLILPSTAVGDDAKQIKSHQMNFGKKGKKSIHPRLPVLPKIKPLGKKIPAFQPAEELKEVPYLKVFQIGQTTLFLVGEDHEDYNQRKKVSTHINSRAEVCKKDVAYLQEATLSDDPKLLMTYAHDKDRLPTGFKGKILPLEGKTRMVGILTHILEASLSLGVLEKGKPKDISEEEYQEILTYCRNFLKTYLATFHREAVCSDNFLKVWTRSVGGFYSNEQIKVIEDAHRLYASHLEKKEFENASNVRGEVALPDTLGHDKAYEFAKAALKVMIDEKMVAPNQEKQLLAFDKIREKDQRFYSIIDIRWRNLEMAESINQALADPSPPKELYVVVGVGHVEGLDYELKKKYPKLKKLHSHLDPENSDFVQLTRMLHVGP